MFLDFNVQSLTIKKENYNNVHILMTEGKMVKFHSFLTHSKVVHV